MAKALSVDLRRRVADAIERGLSRRQAAERFGVSASSAIRWFERLKEQGDVAPKRQGGDRKSGRIEAEADFLLGAVAEAPDITLAEVQEKLQARGVSAGIGTLWRFFLRWRITFKKDGARRRAATLRREGCSRGVLRRAIPAATLSRPSSAIVRL
ncbi:hypothetical protein CU048_06520 [Beijerinckiaceae bacterium]|nr:hypothetical protein CU048_06520 [Beijerinckiaceae bacterium]